MLYNDIVRLSTRMFRTDRSRTILTILGISVGISAILFLVSLGYGMQRMILNQITSSDALLSLDVTTGEIPGLVLNEKIIDDIKKIAGVERISPVVSAITTLKIDDISSEITVNFSNSDYPKLEGLSLLAGVFFDDQLKEGENILLTSGVLQLYNIKVEEVIGKKVQLTFFKQDKNEVGENINKPLVDNQEYYVIGIIEDEDTSYALAPLVNAQELNLNEYSKLKVKVDNDKNIGLVRSLIIEKGFAVSALSDLIDQANQVFKIIQIILGSFGIIALIVSAIGMFNTMTIALLERTQEIGIMKALGASDVDIWNLFIAESLIIGFLGGVGGILIGILGGEIINYFLNILAGALGGKRIDIFSTPYWFIGLIMALSSFVGILTGFYPARRAAKINMLEALRYK